MAALQKIRSKSGLLVAVIAVGLLAFVFPWNEVFTFFNKLKDKAFVVDGDVVSTQNYSERVLEWEDFEKMRRNSNSLDEQMNSQIKELVYQQMVKEMMLDKEAEKLGLTITSEELNDMVYGQNVSPILYQLFSDPQTGQFDKTMLVEFLANINRDISSVPEAERGMIMQGRVFWAFIQNMLKYQRLEEKYSSLVAGSILVNDAEVQANYKDSKNVADIAYVVQRYSTIADSTVQVSDSEIKALYDLRKSNFKLDSELRKISYFIKDVIPSEDDFLAVEKEMETVYEKMLTSDNPALLVNEYSSNPHVDAFMSESTLPADIKMFVQSANIGDVQVPVREGQSYIMYRLLDKTNAADSINMKMLPLPTDFDAATVTHLSDSLLAVIKNGRNFSDVANELLPGANGGEVGWVTEMMLSNMGIAKECFSASKGDLLKLTGSGQTYLIEIGDKTSPVSKVKLAVVQVPVFISDKTQNSIDNELNQFVSENGNPENFDKAALAKGYSLIPNTIVSPSEQTLAQVPGSRTVINWAFNEKVGASKKFEMSDKRIVAIINNEITGDYLPQSEVTDVLKSELIRDKKAEKIIADLKAKNLTSLDAYAQEVSGKVDTLNFVTFQSDNLTGGIGFEPIINVYAKNGQVNKLESPLKGRSGVYILSITNKKEEAQELDANRTKQVLKQSNYYQVMSQAVNSLRNKMKVEDNRVKFW